MATQKTSDLDEYLTSLLMRRMKLQRQVALLDIELNRFVLSGGKIPDVAEGSDVTSNGDGEAPAQVDPEKSLNIVVYEALLQKPMPLKELAAYVIRSGYKTRSKNFPTVIQNTIQTLQVCQAVKRVPQKDSRTSKYAAIKMPEKVLRQRISEQNKNRRQGRLKAEAD